jgi:hypothetical protein
MSSKARDYKREYKLQKARGEHEDRMDRQRARRAYDKKGINREGKVIDHKTPLSKGGSNAPSNLRLTTRSKNASFSRNSDGSVKRNVPKKR